MFWWVQSENCLKYSFNNFYLPLSVCECVCTSKCVLVRTRVCVGVRTYTHIHTVKGQLLWSQFSPSTFYGGSGTRTQFGRLEQQQRPLPTKPSCQPQVRSFWWVGILCFNMFSCYHRDYFSGQRSILEREWKKQSKPIKRTDFYPWEWPWRIQRKRGLSSELTEERAVMGS